MTATPAPAGARMVDLHAHLFPPDLPPGPNGWTWPRLEIGPDSGRIMVGDTVFRVVAPTLWSLPDRLAHLDENSVDLQLVSPVPVALTYGAPAAPAARFMAAVNDGIAEQVRASDDRLVGLGTVPLQDPDLAVKELERLVGELGLAGAEIGTVVGRRELDDPALDVFFAAAEDLGARLALHPMDGGTGVVRRTGQPYDFGLGMLTDTALAAGALVFGGVLDRHPGLQVLLAHGGGSFTWAYPRLRLMAATRDDRDFDTLARRLYVDTLVFDPAHLALLGHRFGPDHVTLGTDFPFFPGQERANAAMLAAAVAEHGLPADFAARIAGENALRFLGRTA